jgi:hypothetical protein
MTRSERAAEVNPPMPTHATSTRARSLGRLAPRRATLRRALLVASALASPTFVSPASAGDAAAADQLFREGKALFDAGRVSEACTKFEASYAADPALGALLNLANCLEAEGRTASAYGKWSDASDLARRAGDPRGAYAEERRRALEPQLARLKVVVTGKADDLQIYRGETKLQPGAYGTKLPTDPGTVAVQVVRGDDVLWEQSVQMLAGKDSELTVDLDAISASNPSPLGQRARRKAVVGPSVTTEATGFWTTPRIVGTGLGAAGIVAVGVGLGLGGAAMGTVSDLDVMCPAEIDGRRYCSGDYEGTRQSAAMLADTGQWLAIGGGVLAAVGVTLVIVGGQGTARELEERAGSPTLVASPWVGPAGAGVGLGGSF